MMRAALTSGLAAVLMGASASPVSAADVRIVPLSGPTKTITLESLAGQEDVVDRTYTLRSRDGETTQTVTGFSLGSLLSEADADVFTFSYLEIARPGGGSLNLDNEQVRDSESFDGPPVVYSGSDGGAAVIRPSTSASDFNAPDAFSAAPLEITLRSGALIDVEASASKHRVDPDETVTFSASVTRSGAGQDIAYSWQFDDGASAEGAQATHRFDEPGSYDVVVGATAPGDDTGGSDVVTIQVGKPRDGGPDRRGGGTNEDDDAPDSGRSDGPGGTTSGSGSGSAGGTGPTSAAPAPTPSTEADSSPAPEPNRQDQQPQPSAGEEVEGELLDGLGTVVPVEAETKPAPQSVARTGTPADQGNASLPGGAAAALLFGGLLGLGALAETERLSRFVPGRRI